MNVDHFAGAVDANGDQWFKVRTVDVNVDQCGERGDTSLSSVSLFGDGHTTIS